MLRPLLFTIDPEAAHRATIALLKHAPLREATHDPRLTTTIAGLTLPNPIGLAAGFDKDGEVPDAMLRLGFGFVEIGTVTPLPQAGNARPRLFRLVADRGVVNRLGFNNRGQAALARRVAGRKRTGIVGINIGANKDAADRIADYAHGVAAMAPFADYLTINISSPNTPGLRALQDEGALAALLDAVRGARDPGGPPVFLKVAPDLAADEAAAIVRASVDHGIDALIVANTTIARPPLRSRDGAQAGGLSGAPLRAIAMRALTMFADVGDRAIPLIAAGGIASADDVWERLAAGASAVQLYSALVYEGPGLARRIARGLVARLDAAGLATTAEVRPLNVRAV